MKRFEVDNNDATEWESLCPLEGEHWKAQQII